MQFDALMRLWMRIEDDFRTVLNRGTRLANNLTLGVNTVPDSTIASENRVICEV